MNILYVSHESDLNGASQSLLNIIDTLLPEHRIWVLSPYQSGPFMEELRRRDVEILSVPYYRWCVAKKSALRWAYAKLKWYVRDQWVNLRTAKKVAALAAERHIDIIHSNTSVENIGALISKYSEIAHVWHIREFADLDFNMYPLPAERKYYAFMNRYCNRFICISRAVAEHYGRLDAEKKTIVYNGVGSNNVISRTFEVHSPNVEFLLSGRISEAKGQACAVEAARILLSRKVKNFRLNLAGSGDFAALHAEDLAEHVVYRGIVRDMPKLRETMDVELVCSRAEAFGRVTAEAMMGGMPVIGSNTGGTVELVRPGETGLLYQQSDPNSLADAMQEFIEKPEYRIELGRNAQEYAKKHFTIQRCASEILDTYQDVLAHIQEGKPESKDNGV